MSTIDFLNHLRDQGIGIRLEGEHLRITAPPGTLTVELRAELTARRDELKAFLLEVATLHRARESIPAAPRDEPLPLSHGQQRLWFLHQFDPHSTEYNVPIILRIGGALDLSALQRAVATVIDRHEVLRTTFSASDGQPRQRIHPPAPVPLPVTDLSDLAADVAHDAAARLVSAEIDRAFALASGPLMRASVLKLDRDDHVLAIVLHHIVCDEWSAHLLHAELATLYEAFRHDQPDPLPRPAVQYADFALWQQRSLGERQLHDDLVYWREQLADLTPLQLPTDRPHPPVRDPAGGTVTFTIPQTTVDTLAGHARAHDATLFMALLAAFQVLLARWTGQPDIVVGSPVAGRSHPDTEDLIGFFANTVALRGDLSGNPPFHQILDQLRGTVLDAFSHQDLPFERLVERLAPQRDRSRHPLFQVMFNVEDMTGADRSPFTDTCLRPFKLPVTTVARFDLRLVLTLEHDGVQGVLEYRRDLFGETTVRGLADRFSVLVDGIVTEPQQPIGALPVLTRDERETLAAWSSPMLASTGRLLPDLVTHHARTRPDSAAVSSAGQPFTWRELDDRARRIGHHLRRLGVGPDAVVAVAVAANADLLTALVGVWYAGGAFLVLNPAEPLTRVAHQLATSAAQVVLADETGQDLLPAGAYVLTTLASAIEEPADPDLLPLHPAQMAYLVFTSGSTGRPKPVAVTHANLAHYGHAVVQRLGIRDGRWLLAQRLSVDLGLTSLAAALVTGAPLHVADPDRLVAELRDARPEHLKLAPAHLRMLLTQPEPVDVLPRRTLVLGGEAAPAALLQALADCGWTGRLHNHYGPAETTVGATTWSHTGDGWPLGAPLPGITCHVVDRWGSLAPIGTPGELCVGGGGVARGYLSAPDVTAARFVADPWTADGVRLYRTGDRARWRADGQLEFLGRLDDQLNVNGHRVHPLEIERVLIDHPSVQDAAVRADPTAQRLIAWIVPAVPDELRRWLGQRLPPPLIPDAFVALDQLPRTAHGKLNTAVLPAPTPHRPALVTEPPTGPTEESLAGLWRELLGVPTVNRTDNFFDLGGHSLLATQLLARIPAELPLSVLFDHPTLAELAAHVDQELSAAGSGTLREEVSS